MSQPYPNRFKPFYRSNRSHPQGRNRISAIPTLVLTGIRWCQSVGSGIDTVVDPRCPSLFQRTGLRSPSGNGPRRPNVPGIQPECPKGHGQMGNAGTD